jgi:hypothetical protein
MMDDEVGNWKKDVFACLGIISPHSFGYAEEYTEVLSVYLFMIYLTLL